MTLQFRLETMRDWVLVSRGRNRVAIAFFAGATSALSMAPFFFWPILFLTLPILVWLIDHGGQAESPGRVLHTGRFGHRGEFANAFRDGWVFGFGYFLAGMFWIGEPFLVEADKFAWLLPFAVTLLPAILALFYGASTAIARFLWPKGLARVFALAVSLAAFEWLRGNILTGLPWNTLGYALTQPLVLMQSASVFGVYGLTLWVVLICASPLVLAAGDHRHGRGQKGYRFAGVIIATVLLFAAAGAGHLTLRSAPTKDVAGVKMRLVQPSIPQEDKWDPSKKTEIFNGLLSLTESNSIGISEGLSEITHVIWPEAAIPFLILRTPEALRAIAQTLPDNTHLLTGAVRFHESVTATTPVDQRIAFNSLLVFNGLGLLVGLSDKTHLVPFGEYLPLSSILKQIGLKKLTAMRAGFAPSETPRQLLAVSGLPPIAPLICYEAIFPNEIVSGTNRPGVLLNVTNDAWFGELTGPRQHFHQNRLRAVEQGVPLVRVSNNGISAVIDPYGRIKATLPLNHRASIDATLPAAREPTLYASYGDFIALLLGLIFSAFGIILACRPHTQNLS